MRLAEPCLTEVSDPWLFDFASAAACFGRWKADDLTSLCTTPRGESPPEAEGHIFAAVYRLCFEGVVELEQLRMSAAERHYQSALRLAQRHAGADSAMALPVSLMAAIRYEQGRVDEAEAMLVDRIPIISATGMLECVLSAFLVLVRAAVERGDGERAHSLLAEAEQLGRARKWGRLTAAVLVEKLQLHLAQGAAAESAACMARLEQLEAEHPAPCRCAWSDIHAYAELARALLASSQARWHESAAILRKLHDEAQTGRPYFALRLAIPLAAALFNANRADEAVHVFRGAISLAAAAGIHQTFVDQRAAFGPLPSRLGSDARSMAYLQAFAPPRAEASRPAHEPPRTQSAAGEQRTSAVELMSPRERTILELIGHGQSNKEIARGLGIAPETVKCHVKHIFAKLNVNKRIRAVSVGHLLGLGDA